MKGAWDWYAHGGPIDTVDVCARSTPRAARTLYLPPRALPLYSDRGRYRLLLRFSTLGDASFFRRLYFHSNVSSYIILSAISAFLSTIVFQRGILMHFKCVALFENAERGLFIGIVDTFNETKQKTDQKS